MKSMVQVVQNLLKPYIDSQIQTLTNQDSAMLNVLGAKNLMAGEFKSTVHRGVTFTVDPNTGVISASGAVTTGEEYSIIVSSNFTLPAGSYVLNGSPTPVNANGSYLDLYDMNNHQVASSRNNADKPFTLSVATEMDCRLVVLPIDGTVSLTCKPMIRPANIQDATYAPYSKTNRELTTQTKNLKAYKPYNSYSFTAPLSWGLTGLTISEDLGSLCHIDLQNQSSSNYRHLPVTIPTAVLLNSDSTNPIVLRRPDLSALTNAVMVCTNSSGVLMLYVDSNFGDGKLDIYFSN